MKQSSGEREGERERKRIERQGLVIKTFLTEGERIINSC